MTLRIEGFAIISEDCMLADATGAMPSTLLIEADQRFLSDGLDRASVVVHGRNSHENQPRSPQQRRLIATRMIESIAPAPDQPKALLWNPAGLSLEKAAEVVGVRHGTAAILGGTEIFGLFLPRYDVFYLSRVAGLHLSGGRPIFPQVPQRSAEEVLTSSKLTQAAQRPLDVATMHYFNGNGKKARVRF
jgi:dihydrofolate reductase